MNTTPPRLLPALLAASLGCASAPPAGDGGPSADTSQAARATEAGAIPDDTVGLIPPGYGTLRQDDIAIRLQGQGLQVRVIPLDEPVIRTLSPDSYRALHDLQESRRLELSAAARRAGLQEYRVWYVSFFGIEAEARFSPRELVVNNVGRDFRPAEVLPLTAGFGEQKLRQRETQSALYVFDGALDASQPLTVTYQTAENASWGTTLRRIEAERARIRSRSAQRPSN